MAAKILITPHPRYMSEESRPDQAHYSFAYTIEIENQSPQRVQLLERHWIITDANGQRTEVQGPGVVGEQPWLRPGEDFRYTSGAVLETALGTMQGRYDMLADDGTRFDAPIAPFTLSVPRTLH